MRILLSGYYGFRNTGDEAVLAGIIEGLRRRLPEVELCVLSADPPATSAEYGVDAADRWRTPVIWSELRRADFLIQGGGSLLQDVTSPQSPIYYLGVLHMARLARTPYMIFAQGIGPLRSAFLRGVTVRNLRRARAVTVRDDESARMLREWGLSRPEVQVTADPGLLVAPSDEERREELLRQLDLSPDQPYMVIALREWPGLQALLPHLVELLRRRDEALLVLPFQFERDLPLALDLSRMLPNRVHLPRDLLSPADSVAVIKGARAVIGMRLHAMIFAAAVQTPAVAISYDPKVDVFARRGGLPVLHLDEVTPERLEHCLADSLAARDRDQGGSRLDDLKAAAERSFDVLLEALPKR
ncbi:polysaccharide pyruvyl transferase CsaB [bacterium]|nr:polysaccharide pyruvyl transferase CsaB [bacterium]